MKKMIIVLFICISNAIFAMDYSVQFPQKDEFTQQLKGKIPAHVIKQLKLSETFAGQIMTPYTVAITLNGSFNNYVNGLKTPANKIKATHFFGAKRKTGFYRPAQRRGGPRNQ